MEGSKVWRVQARVNGFARRSQRQEDHRVEYVRHLAHQKEPGKSVLAGGLPGGQGYDSTSTTGNGNLNDMWRYLPYQN